MLPRHPWSLALLFTSLMLADSPSTSAVDFAHEVLPILKEHCASCHAGKRKEGGLGMNTREQLLSGGESGESVSIGNSGESELITRIVTEDEGLRMPPDGPRVNPKQVAILRQWIDENLPWDEAITLGKPNWEPPLEPRTVTLPPPHEGRNHPIDRLLDAYLSENAQPLPSPINDAAFLRRASLDVTGLLPTPDALRAFVADPAPDKRDRLIEQLLSNDIAYADHWLTMWNDLLRNDYTGTGFITGGRTQITTWLYAALRDNKPYDQMVRELIAPTDESAGFINGIQWRGETNASQTREIQFAQNISQVFLGINMKCASCHDSFIDRWKLSDAYQLAAIYSDHPLEIHRCDKPTGTLATAKWIFPELGDVDPNAPKAERLNQLAQLMTHPQNGRFTRTVVNRVWHRLMGRGIVHPVDAMHTQAWNNDLLDFLAVQFAHDGFDLRTLIATVMKSHAYQSQAVIQTSEPGDDYIYSGPLNKRMTAEQFLDSIWQITETHPRSPTAEVNRIGKPPTDDQTPPHTGPVTAKWIWHPDGKIAKTSLRKSIRLDDVDDEAWMMVTCDNAFTLRINGVEAAASKNWQQPQYVNVTPFLRPGENQIEVDAEMFGGACGFICQINSDEATLLVSDQTWQARRDDATWVPAQELHPHGEGPWRTILNPQALLAARHHPAPPVRAALVQNDFLMRSLGRPHRDQVVTTRPSELTTLQAIDLANGEILADHLRRGAERLTRRHELTQPGEQNAFVDWLFRFALSRPPTADERQVLRDILDNGRDRQAVEDLLWTVFMLPEFQTI